MPRVYQPSYHTSTNTLWLLSPDEAGKADSTLFCITHLSGLTTLQPFPTCSPDCIHFLITGSQPWIHGPPLPVADGTLNSQITIFEKSHQFLKYNQSKESLYNTLPSRPQSGQRVLYGPFFCSAKTDLVRVFEQF